MMKNWETDIAYYLLAGFVLIALFVVEADKLEQVMAGMM